MLPSLVESVISSLMPWCLVYVSSPVLILRGSEEISLFTCLFLCIRVFKLQHYCHFGLDSSLFWGCPAHCSMCSGCPGLYPLDVISTLSQLRLKEMSPDITRCPLGLGGRVGGRAEEVREPHARLRTTAVYQTRGSSKGLWYPSLYVQCPAPRVP